MSLSSPSPFGDVVEPTIEQDAAAAIRNALALIRRHRGNLVHDCAGHALAALRQNNGLAMCDLRGSIVEALDLDVSRFRDRFAIDYAIADLELLEVVSIVVDERVFLNPAATEAVTRELFR